MKKIAKLFLSLLIIFLLFLLAFWFIEVPAQNNIVWGVNFSQSHTVFLKLDWKILYADILNDLNVKNIKLITNWDWIEPQKGNFNFDDTDWQISEAEKHNAKIIYVVGMKTGRWPECHLPDWANVLSQKEQQDELLKYINEVILRYKDKRSIVAWQVENEPLFKFGICPWYDRDFLKKEVDIVKSIDPERPIVISDSGEQSFWIGAARLGDIVGTTMYRKVWFHINDNYGFYIRLPIPAKIYWIKSQIINYIFDKKVINVELQGEPWFPDIFKELSIEEQEKLMNREIFLENINYAKKSGLDTFYLWGVEWWYYMKKEYNRPEIWDEARNLFKN